MNFDGIDIHNSQAFLLFSIHDSLQILWKWVSSQHWAKIKFTLTSLFQLLASSSMFVVIVPNLFTKSSLGSPSKSPHIPHKWPSCSLETVIRRLPPPSQLTLRSVEEILDNIRLEEMISDIIPVRTDLNFTFEIKLYYRNSLSSKCKWNMRSSRNIRHCSE